jgi:hypothetical protein
MRQPAKRGITDARAPPRTGTPGTGRAYLDPCQLMLAPTRMVAAPEPCTERNELPMQDERNEMNPTEDVVAQRAIVLQVLREDHVKPWTRAELESEIYDIEPLAISDALAALNADGVVNIAGEQVRASRAARRMDALGMVSI